MREASEERLRDEDRRLVGDLKKDMISRTDKLADMFVNLL